MKENRIEITAACKMCRICLKNCPVKAILSVDGARKAEDISKWKGIMVFVESIDKYSDSNGECCRNIDHKNANNAGVGNNASSAIGYNSTNNADSANNADSVNDDDSANNEGSLNNECSSNNADSINNADDASNADDFKIGNGDNIDRIINTEHNHNGKKYEIESM